MYCIKEKEDTFFGNAIGFMQKLNDAIFSTFLKYKITNGGDVSAETASGTIHTIVRAPVEHSSASDGDAHCLSMPVISLAAADVIAASLEALARQALDSWPQWYGEDGFAESPSPFIEDRLHSLFVILDLVRKDRGIEPAWLKKASLLAAQGKIPLIPGVPGEIQARQLALVLREYINAIRFDIPSDAAAASCFGFPKAVEWLARESGLDIVVTVPSRLAALDDLAPLLYGASQQTPSPSGRTTEYESEQSKPDRAAAAPLRLPHIPDENAPEAERLIGKPHPRSNGEQLLAEWLMRDAELRGLFGHNLPVVTRCGRRFLVDLLWADGGMVVEVDGYFYHNNAIEFAADRDRDYRLLLSGYRVLRLTNDEVVRDTGLAVEKIRDVVHFIHNEKSGNTHVK